MNETERNIWFPAKKHGWGWGLPVTFGAVVSFNNVSLIRTAGGAGEFKIR